MTPPCRRLQPQTLRTDRQRRPVSLDGLYQTNEVFHTTRANPFAAIQVCNRGQRMRQPPDTGPAAVYWKDVPNEADPLQAVKTLTMWLKCLRGFFWLCGSQKTTQSTVKWDSWNTMSLGKVSRTQATSSRLCFPMREAGKMKWSFASRRFVRLVSTSLTSFFP